MTLQGDVFDLSGTLEGGAMQSQFSVLQSVSALAEVSGVLEVKKSKLAEVDTELSALTKVESR